MYAQIEYWLAMLPSWRPWHPISHEVPCRSCAKSPFFLAIDWPAVPHSAIHGLISSIEHAMVRTFAPPHPRLDFTPYVAPEPWEREGEEAFREILADIESGAQAEVRDVYVGDFIRRAPTIIAALNRYVVPRVDEWIQQQQRGLRQDDPSEDT